MMKSSRFILPAVLLFSVLLGGLVLAGIYPGNNLLVAVADNATSPMFVGNLVAYGDVDGNASGYLCFDNDGVNPTVGSYMSWFDGGVGYYYPETCTSGTVLNELICGQNALIATISTPQAPAPGYALSVDIDCGQAGFSACSVVSGVARCV